MKAMNCPLMMSLGVYVLGAADPAERTRLEAHLPGCEECQAELTRLAPLPGLLAAIPEGIRAPAPAAGRQATRSRPARVHRSARPRPARAMAGAVLAAAAAVTAGLWLTSGSGGHPPGRLTFTGADTGTHVSATATLTAMSWGTSIQLQLRGLPENVQCQLIVRSRAGQTEVSGTWDAWQQGPMNIPASAAWLPSDIASLRIATPTRTLLTISVAHLTGEAGR
jgi:hypothetical protein